MILSARERSCILDFSRTKSSELRHLAQPREKTRSRKYHRRPACDLVFSDAFAENINLQTGPVDIDNTLGIGGSIVHVVLFIAI